MSSPVVNKDILYCWSIGGYWYLGFYFGESEESPGENCGWSWYMDVGMNKYKKIGWSWSEEEPFNEPSVGHRCLLQW